MRRVSVGGGSCSGKTTGNYHGKLGTFVLEGSDTVV
jgi:hypothetical protein